MPDDHSDPLAALIKTQAVSDSLNVKRMGGGLKEKRGFKADVKEGWDWIKDSFKAPGLGARSTDSPSVSSFSHEEESRSHEKVSDARSRS